MGLLSDIFSRAQRSGSIAKDRLKMALLHDRADLTPKMMEELREELITVLEKYIEIDKKGMDIELARAETRFDLIANIPVTTIRRGGRKDR